MLLYKFRSLQNIEFDLDIILNERLYCAPYDELNDPFEGLFYASYPLYTYPGPGRTNQVTTGKCKTAKDFFTTRTKICSLSESLKDVLLWAHYARGNKGIAIEIDFSDNKKDIYNIDYGDNLKTLGDTPFTNTSPTEVLSYKTKHWKYENEYRIIQEEDYYPITGRIKSIFTGERISDLHNELLHEVTRIPIIPTKINTEEIIVEPIYNSK